MPIPDLSSLILAALEATVSGATEDERKTKHGE